MTCMQSRRLYEAEKRQLEELVHTLREEQRMREELQATISDLRGSSSAALTEIRTLEGQSRAATREHEEVMARLRDMMSSTESTLRALHEEEDKSAQTLSEMLCARATAELRLAEMGARTDMERESLLRVAEEGALQMPATVRRGLLGGGDTGGVLQQFRTYFHQSTDLSPSTAVSSRQRPLLAASRPAPEPVSVSVRVEEGATRHREPTAASHPTLRPGDIKISVLESPISPPPGGDLSAITEVYPPPYASPAPAHTPEGKVHTSKSVAELGGGLSAAAMREHAFASSKPLHCDSGTTRGGSKSPSTIPPSPPPRVASDTSHAKPTGNTTETSSSPPLPLPITGSTQSLIQDTKVDDDAISRLTSLYLHSSPASQSLEGAGMSL